MKQLKNNKWSDNYDALSFAQALCSVKIEDDFDVLSTKRFSGVLEVLAAFAPIRLATLWKIKKRSGVASAIARVRYSPDPTLQENYTEYCCPLSGSCIDTFIDLSNICENDFKHTYIKDVSKYDDDRFFNTKKRIKDENLNAEIFIPFSISSEDEYKYFLNIYTDGVEVDFLPIPFLIAIIDKLKSGFAASIECKENKIHSEMSSIEANSRTSPVESAKIALKKVIPNFILCRETVLLLEDKVHNLQVAHGQIVTGDKNSFVGDTVKLTEYLFQIRENLVGPLIVQSAELPEELFHNQSELRSLLIVPVGRSLDNDHPRGYLIFLNRFNDLARQHPNSAFLPDFFDWEDERIAKRIAATLHLIFEVSENLERVLHASEIIAHELYLPSSLIIATAHRLEDDAHGTFQLPIQQRRSEIDDILVAAELQNALINSLQFRLRDSKTPRLVLYPDPQDVSLSTVSKRVAKILMPIARKFRVSGDNIIIQEDMPNLFLDESALTQILLNIIGNGVKYSLRNSPKTFTISVSGSVVSVDMLESRSEVPSDYINELRIRDVQFGVVVSIKDLGIGIRESDRFRIFEPGKRGVNTTTVQGAGLGLSVVRRIMRDHYGEIWVERTSKRTEFQIFFPENVLKSGYEKQEDWKII